MTAAGKKTGGCAAAVRIRSCFYSHGGKGTRESDFLKKRTDFRTFTCQNSLRKKTEKNTGLVRYVRLLQSNSFRAAALNRTKGMEFCSVPVHSLKRESLREKTKTKRPLRLYSGKGAEDGNKGGRRKKLYVYGKVQRRHNLYGLDKYA